MNVKHTCIESNSRIGIQREREREIEEKTKEEQGERDLRMLTSTPCERRYSAISVKPFRAAWCRGVNSMSSPLYSFQ
jgi:hypothetical protein